MWVVTVHECSGSTAEAIDAYSSFGGFTNEADAKQFAEMLYENLTFASKRHGGYSEWFTQHFEVPDIRNLNIPRGSAEQIKELEAQNGPMPEGHVAFDMLTLAEQIIDGTVEELPPPPKQEEVDEALASIFGKCECDIDYLDPNCRNPNHINPPEEF